MNLEFVLHLFILSVIYYIISTGFKFFLKLKGTLDFSYFGIVIFGAYLGSIINVDLHIGILGSMFLSFLISILFTIFILFLSNKLDEIYFTIGTFTLYILVFQLAYNLDSITGGALGFSGMKAYLRSGFDISNIHNFAIFCLIILLLFVSVLLFIKKTYFFKILQGRGENENVVRSLGIKVNIYKFFMILITTFLASVGGNLFAFYYLYIDPSSFWLGFIINVLVIVFISYKYEDIGVFLVSLLFMFIYEYLRFFKIVDPSYVGYFREIMLGIIIMISSYFIFKKTRFGRDV